MAISRVETAQNVPAMALNNMDLSRRKAKFISPASFMKKRPILADCE
jgi:hypothetical protein